MNDFSDIPVVIFSMGEPASKLSKHCFKVLGFDNIVMFENQSTFAEKFIEFSQYVYETNYQYYVRSDSDRFVFEGMVDLVETARSNDVEHIEGVGFDYFMNKFRGATPQVYHRKTLLKLWDDNNLIGEVPKPESTFCRNASITSKDGSFAFTNLHDYYQTPSKACNTFLNRFIRDGMQHYDLQYIKTLPDYYILAFNHAITQYNNGNFTNDMNYKDFSFLDDYVNLDVNLDREYTKLSNIYETKRRIFK